MLKPEKLKKLLIEYGIKVVKTRETNENMAISADVTLLKLINRET